jgi:hypothetical protein
VDAGELCATCPADCGECCGNGACDLEVGETEETCPGDCDGACGDGVCSPARIGDDFDSVEFCYECPGDCGAFCGDRGCRAIFENAWFCERDVFCYVRAMDDATPEAQAAFAALYACWQEECVFECLSIAGCCCQECSESRCEAELDACLSP